MNSIKDKQKDKASNGEEMKLALPTDEEGTLEDSVVSHFGRAKNFLIYNTKTEKIEICLNPEVSGGQELPPDFLHRLGVKAVIVFNLGQKAIAKFQNFNIKVYEAVEGSISENIKAFQNNQLNLLD